MSESAKESSRCGAQRARGAGEEAGGPGGGQSGSACTPTVRSGPTRRPSSTAHAHAALSTAN